MIKSRILLKKTAFCPIKIFCEKRDGHSKRERKKIIVLHLKRVFAGTATNFSSNREVKHDVYGKRLTAKMKLLPSVFSSLYSRTKIFVFAVNSNRHVSIFV